MVIKAAGTFLAVFAFAVLIETPKKYLFYAGVIGGIGGFCYLISERYGFSVVLSSFISACAVSLVSHIFARILKTPVTVFLIAGILPTVPGAGMYRIVYYIIAGNSAMSSYYFIETLEVAGVIALAVFFVDTLFRLNQKGWKQSSLQYKRDKKEE